jgi:hypothetical protein
MTATLSVSSIEQIEPTTKTAHFLHPLVDKWTLCGTPIDYDRWAVRRHRDDYETCARCAQVVNLAVAGIERHAGTDDPVTEAAQLRAQAMALLAVADRLHPQHRDDEDEPTGGERWLAELQAAIYVKTDQP